MVTPSEVRARRWLKEQWGDSFDDETVRALGREFDEVWREGERSGAAGRDPFLAKVDDRVGLEEVCLRILEGPTSGYSEDYPNSGKAYDRTMALRRRAAEILLSGLPKREEPEVREEEEPLADPQRPFGETMIPLGPSTLLGLRGVYADGGERIGLHVEVAEGTKRLPSSVSVCWEGRNPPPVPEILARIEIGLAGLGKKMIAEASS